MQGRSRCRVTEPAYSGASRSRVRFQEAQMASTLSHRVPSRSKSSPSNRKNTLHHKKNHIHRDAAAYNTRILYHIRPQVFKSPARFFPPAGAAPPGPAAHKMERGGGVSRNPPV